MEPLDKAAEIIGSQAAIALLCGVSRGAVNQWKDPGRKIPAEYCPILERATNGVVRCEDLRPDVQWDVLRQQGGTDVAPPVVQAEAKAA